MKYLPLSVSKIGVFNQCQKRFHFQYVQKIKQKPSIHFEKGNFIHGLIESVLKSAKYKQDKPFAIMTKEEVSENLKIALDFCKGELFQKVLALSKVYPFNVESAISLDINYKPCDRWKGNPFLIGKIDFEMELPDSFKIIDWKTGKAPSEFFKKDEDQLDLYALAMMLKTGKPGRASFIFIEHNVVQKKDYTLNDIDGIKRTFEEYARIISNETEFRTNESGLCKNCSYIDICPAFN